MPSRPPVTPPLTDDAVAPVAALLADPARVAMLWSLADGRRRASGDLARLAGVSPSTASEHLARLLDGGLLVVERQGRSRHYRVSSPTVVEALELLGALAQPRAHGVRRRRPPAVSGLRHARACYDHLAGALGVQVTRALLTLEVIQLRDERFEVPDRAGEFFEREFGIDLEALRTTRRSFARACLDWTERDHHVAGALGAALLDAFLARGWVERTRGSRALDVTARGRRGFRAALNVDALGSRFGS